MDQRVAHLVSVVDTYRKENSELASKLTQISQQVDTQSCLQGRRDGLLSSDAEQRGRLTNVLLTRVCCYYGAYVDMYRYLYIYALHYKHVPPAWSIYYAHSICYAYAQFNAPLL
jgi:hypothetical protein